MELEEFIKRIELESCLFLPLNCQFPYPLAVTWENGTYDLSFQDDRGHLLSMPSIDINALYLNIQKDNTFFSEDVREQMKTAVCKYVKEYETACKKDCKYQEQFTALTKDFPAKQVFYTLLPIQKHQEKLYKHYPYTIKNDIAFIYSIYLNQTEHARNSCFIYNDLFQKWQISIKELHQAAVRNTPKLFPYMVREINAGQDITAYEVTNQQHLYGLGTLFYEEGPLKEIAAEQNRSLFVFCLSVHEAIVIPDDGKIQKKELENLIQEIHPFSREIYYYYDKDSGALAMNALEKEELEVRQKMAVMDAAEKNSKRRTEKQKWEK